MDTPELFKEDFVIPKTNATSLVSSRQQPSISDFVINWTILPYFMIHFHFLQDSMILNFLAIVFEHRLMKESKKESATASIVSLIAFLTCMILLIIKNRIQPRRYKPRLITLILCSYEYIYCLTTAPYTVIAVGLFLGWYATLIVEEYLEELLLDTNFDWNLM